MRGAVLSLFLIFAIMLGSKHASAVTHAHDMGAALALELIDDDHHVFDVPHDADDRGDSAPDGKGEQAQHHHCSVGLANLTPRLCRGTGIVPVKPTPSLVTSLASLTSAPLIEPPAA